MGTVWQRFATPWRRLWPATRPRPLPWPSPRPSPRRRRCWMRRLRRRRQWLLSRLPRWWWRASRRLRRAGNARGSGCARGEVGSEEDWVRPCMCSVAESVGHTRGYIGSEGFGGVWEIAESVGQRRRPESKGARCQRRETIETSSESSKRSMKRTAPHSQHLLCFILFPSIKYLRSRRPGSHTNISPSARSPTTWRRPP